MEVKLGELIRIQTELSKIELEITSLRKRLVNVKIALSNKKIIQNIGENRAIETISQVINDLTLAIKDIENIIEYDFKKEEKNVTSGGRL